MRRLLVVAALFVLACDVKPEPGGDVAAWRAEKDRFMRSRESPVPEEKRATFPPLPEAIRREADLLVVTLQLPEW